MTSSNKNYFFLTRYKINKSPYVWLFPCVHYIVALQNLAQRKWILPKRYISSQFSFQIRVDMKFLRKYLRACWEYDELHLVLDKSEVGGDGRSLWVEPNELIKLFPYRIQLVLQRFSVSVPNYSLKDQSTFQNKAVLSTSISHFDRYRNDWICWWIFRLLVCKRNLWEIAGD